MKKIVSIALLSLLVLPTLVFAEPRIRPADWARPVIESALKNCYRVDENLYRSAQPDKEGFRDSVTLGIREVLNLREHHSDDGKAKGLDLTLHRIKIKTGSISQEDLAAALTILKNRKGPVLVHCWHGSDRTGAVIAAYRIVFQGWSKEKAIDELTEGGYGYHARVYPNVVELIQTLDVDAMKKRLGLDDNVKSSQSE